MRVAEALTLPLAPPEGLLPALVIAPTHQINITVNVSTVHVMARRRLASSAVVCLFAPARSFPMLPMSNI